MDSQTTIEEIKKSLEQFGKDRGWKPDSRSMAISIALEAAELLEHYQWAEEGDQDFLEIQRELADVMIYCVRFAILNNIDISEAIREKMEVNTIKYPSNMNSDSSAI